MIQKITLLTIGGLCIVVGGCLHTESLNLVCVEDNCVQVEIADTNEKRMEGLMYRKSLDEKSGMLFIFPQEGMHGFWMKNTIIPLDMIWIDKDKKIVDIQTAEPCTVASCPSYMPSGAARYVLEINANASESFGFRNGVIVDIK